MPEASHPYASSAYAYLFQNGMTPVELKQSRSYILTRPIASTDAIDATGPYPMTPLAKAADYTDDFDTLRRAGAVSLVMVTDTFFCPEEAWLKQQFDVCAPFKEHFVHDLQASEEERKFSKHHRYEVRKSLRSCETRLIDLNEHLDAWCAMYNALIERHAITGIQAFGREYFEHLCALNPLTIGAFDGNELVSAHIWLEHEGYVYSHLAASTDKGYSCGAAYPIYAHAIEHYREQGAKIMDFGGGAGTSEASAGLARFKKGFSTGTVGNFLLGKILDEARYQQLSEPKGKTAFFPAYRAS